MTAEKLSDHATLPDDPADCCRLILHFSPAEIACRSTGSLRINEEALDKLQALRDRLGKPLIVRSAYRSPDHNCALGGATRSKHLVGAAFDIAMAKNQDPVAFEAAARVVGFLCIMGAARLITIERLRVHRSRVAASHASSGRTFKTTLAQQLIFR